MNEEKKTNTYMYRPQKVRPKNLTFWRSVFFMTKYNFEFKKKVVLEYINENISIRSLAKKYAIKIS